MSFKKVSDLSSLYGLRGHLGLHVCSVHPRKEQKGCKILLMPQAENRSGYPSRVPRHCSYLVLFWCTCLLILLCCLGRLVHTFDVLISENEF